MKGLNEEAREAARIATEHGFGDATVGEEIALMHSELSEALEDVRNGASPIETWNEIKVRAIGIDGKLLFDKDGKPIFVRVTNHDGLGKPCGIPSEIADVMIRALHFCGKHGIDIEKAYAEKMAYNEGREFMHGKKL